MLQTSDVHAPGVGLEPAWIVEPAARGVRALKL